MKIVKVTFDKFRNVPDGTYDLNGKNIILVAENTYGKSNFMKGILATVGAIPFGKTAIRHGANKSSVEIVCAEYKDWQPVPGTEYKFRAELKQDKGEEKVKLEVTAPNGFRDQKKTTIGTIAGELELDYNLVELSRTTAGKKRQLEIFKSYLDDETKQILAVEENKIQSAYNDRTEVGRKLKSVDGFIKEAGLTDDHFRQYAEPVDTTSLRQQRDAAYSHNKKREEVKYRMNERTGSIREIEQKIKQLEAEREDLLKKNMQADAWLKDANNAEKSMDALDQQLAGAEEHNRMHERVKMLQGKLAEKEQLEIEQGELTVMIDTGRQLIADAIRDMNFPIPDISFDSENVYYKGKLIDENNMSTAEIKLLEAQLKMCKAPGLEVLFIGSGESIGLKLLQELQVEANKRGFEIIMEQVERGTEELRVEFMPDYTQQNGGK